MSAPGSGGRRYANASAEDRRAERRRRLLDAGLERFTTSGYVNTTVPELCRAARVSTRSFYEEFGHRRDLLIALHDQLNARALTEAATAVTALPTGDLAARATAGVRAYFEVMTTDPRWARIALVESVGVDAQVDAHRRAAIDRFAVLIEVELRAAADAGVIPHRDFTFAAMGLVGALNELVMAWSRQPDWDAVVEDVVAEAARFIIAAGVPLPTDLAVTASVADRPGARPGVSS